MTGRLGERPVGARSHSHRGTSTGVINVTVAMRDFVVYQVAKEGLLCEVANGHT